MHNKRHDLNFFQVDFFSPLGVCVCGGCIQLETNASQEGTHWTVLASENSTDLAARLVADPPLRVPSPVPRWPVPGLLA